MPCFRPITGYQRAPGEQLVFHDDGGSPPVQIACGRCDGCRLEYARQWAVRGYHESQLHEVNSFLTLTYSDEFLPVNSSVSVREMQLFLKRLRKAVRPAKIRFMCCGEYGESTYRPHYHLIIFGYAFPDRVFLRKSPRGDNVYRSPLLERVWSYGISEIGSVTFDSIGYVARYITKKVYGDAAYDHYQALHAETGEIVSQAPEFFTQSRNPGIGARWYSRFSSDLARDYCVVNGVKQKVPKYYDRLLKKVDPVELSDRKTNREFLAYESRENSTPERLEVRESVLKARLSHLTRSL